MCETRDEIQTLRILTQDAAALTDISAEGSANATNQEEISDPDMEDSGLEKTVSKRSAVEAGTEFSINRLQC